MFSSPLRAYRTGGGTKTDYGWLGIIADRFMRLLSRIPNFPTSP
jgi:hypothetical protein